MDLSVIFVNWNAVAYLRECIADIYEHTRGISFEIIVVDNASPEGGVDSLKEQFPRLIIVKEEKNLGFARANNIGFRHSTGDCALFLNPDTRLCGPAITIMLDRLKSLPDAGVVGCRLLNSDFSVQTTAIQRFPTILNQLLDLDCLQLRWPQWRFWGIAPLFSSEITLARVEVISGACMMMRRAAFEAVGMFSEDYFMYAEDIDLSYKAKCAGLTNYYLAEPTIIHHGGRSSCKQEVNHWATTMKYRAMRLLFRKMRGGLYGSAYRASIGCAAMVRLAVLALAYPLGNIVGNREAVRVAGRKWTTILKWAIGLQEPSFEGR
jgi:hypothetical protein